MDLRVYRPISDDELAKIDSKKHVGFPSGREVLTWPQRVGTMKSLVELQY